MITRLLLAFFLGGIIGGAAAQQRPYLPYHVRDTTQLSALARQHRAAMTTHFVVPKGASAEFRDHYKRIVTAAAQDLYNSVRYTALPDSVLNPQVQRVFKRIVQANPGLPPTRLLLSRNPEPNAYATGDGTVVLNVGLLPKLENESQLAFVLCHELAHTALRHVDTGIESRLAVIHGKELQRAVQRIVLEEYNIASKIKSLALGYSLNTNYHQRRYETQADSLGYALLTRTQYDAPQAYRALELLDVIDQPDAPEPLELGRYFSCASFTRPLTAAPAPKSIFAVQREAPTALELTDTLKSHPDCAKRMRLIRRLAADKVASGPQAGTSAQWERLRQASRLEVVQAWFDYDCYDRAFYGALQQLRREPQNAYLQAVVVLCLYELRQHMQQHKFYEVVSNTSAHNPASFNELLGVLNGLQLADFKNLSACFAQTTGASAPAAGADEYTLAAQYAGLQLADDPARAAAVRQHYQQQYRGGRFDALLFPDPKKTNH
jgi:Zn-dependent protease with chaperone function